MSTVGSLQWQASTHCSASCRLQATRTSQSPSYLCRLWQRQRLARRSAFKVGNLYGYQACRRGKACCAAKRPDPADATQTRAGSDHEDSKMNTASSSNAQPAWKWENSPDAVKAYTALLGFLALGQIPALRHVRFVDLPYFIGLASMTIYIGAHRGLCTKVRQQISIKEGALAPFAASAALFAGYLVVKFFPNLNLQAFLNLYFWLIGSIAIFGALQSPLRQSAGPLGQTSLQFTVPEGLLLDDSGDSITDAQLAPSDIATILVAITAATIDLRAGHQNFTLNNMIACLVATDILQLLGLKSFRTGAVMLAGLLLYDVFWVFGSPSVIGDNVMLTVATSDIVSGPTRLLFPRIAGGTGEASSFPFSLLGLGDIAVPGLLACLALRYDASRAINMGARADAAAEALKGAFSQMDPASSGRQMADTAAEAAGTAVDKVADAESDQRERSEGASTSGSPHAVVEISDAVLQQRTYFVPTMAAYVIGLGIAFGANAITKLGQPALLYLVPATFTAITLTAASRGEIGRLWKYTDNTAISPIKKAKLKTED
ncbi:hypothetical protein WJX82_011264 [Trebouxia sp. C0006]